MQHLFLTAPSLDSGLISHNSILNQETLQIGLFLIYFVPCVGSYSTKMNQTQTNTEITFNFTIFSSSVKEKLAFYLPGPDWTFQIII